MGIKWGACLCVNECVCVYLCGWMIGFLMTETDVSSRTASLSGIKEFIDELHELNIPCSLLNRSALLILFFCQISSFF